MAAHNETQENLTSNQDPTKYNETAFNRSFGSSSKQQTRLTAQALNAHQQSFTSQPIQQPLSFNRNTNNYTLDPSLYSQPGQSTGSQDNSISSDSRFSNQLSGPQSANSAIPQLKNILDLNPLLLLPNSPSSLPPPPNTNNITHEQINVNSASSILNSLDEHSSDAGSRVKSKRRRKPINCSFCRRRKLKCDRKQPCSSCIKRNMQASCVYVTDFPSISPSASVSSNAQSHEYENTPETSSNHADSLYSGNNYDSFINSEMSIPQTTRVRNSMGNNSHILPVPGSQQTLSNSTASGNLEDSSINNSNSLLNQVFISNAKSSSLEGPSLNNSEKKNDGIHITGNLPNSLASFRDDLNTSDSPFSLPSSVPSVSLSNPPTGTSAFTLSSSGVESTPNTSYSENSYSGDATRSYSNANDNSTNRSHSRSSPLNSNSSPSFSLHNGPIHLRNGSKVTNPQVSIGSLAPLFASASRYNNLQNHNANNTPSPLQSTPSSVSSAGTPGELQSRLDTMERLLMTLVKQQTSSENGSNGSSNQSRNGSVHDSSNKSSPLSNQSGSIEGNKITQPADNQKNEDTMTTLRESLGMLKLDTTGKAVYHGDTHWGSLITEIDEVTEILGKLKAESLRLHNQTDSSNEANPGLSNNDESTRTSQNSNDKQPQDPVGSVKNPADQVTTGGCFSNNSYFATIQSNESYMKVLDTLPPRSQCNILIKRYFESFNLIFPIINKTTFDIEYIAFWEDPSTTEMSWMAVFLGMLCLGLQSFSTDTIELSLDADAKAPSVEVSRNVFPPPFRENPEQMWSLWLEGAEYCSNSWKLNFKPSITNIRAMLILTLCQHPSSFDYDWMDQNWIDIGDIVRIAQTMGMHRDPQWFALDIYEREERRRLWYLIQTLDTYQTLLQGLPPLIRTGTTDVQFPAHTNLSTVAKYWKYFQPESNESSPSSFQSANIMCDPFPIRTEMSFFLARSAISMFSTQIYNITTSLETPNVPYEQILALDSKVRHMFNRAHPYLQQSVIDNNSISGIDDNSAEEANSPDSIRSVDTSVALLERFLYEIDYLKALMVLHRKYSSKGLENLKYRRSREETVYSAERMLMLQEWFYKSDRAAKLRKKYSYIVTKFVFPQFTHAVILLALYFIGNHFDSYPLHTARTQLRRIEVSCNIAFDVGQKTGDLHVSKHMHLLVILLREAKTVFKMTPAEREELKAQRQQRKKRHPNKQFTASSSEIMDKYFKSPPGSCTRAPDTDDYSSGYNTFFYASWEFDTMKRQAATFNQNPDQYYNEWRLEHFMDVDDDLNSALNPSSLGYNIQTTNINEKISN